MKQEIFEVGLAHLVQADDLAVEDCALGAAFDWQ
jgi:hypothetical protein